MTAKPESFFGTHCGVRTLFRRTARLYLQQRFTQFLSGLGIQSGGQRSRLLGSRPSLLRLFRKQHAQELRRRGVERRICTALVHARTDGV